MIIDKKQSMKNKVGVLLTSFVLAGTLSPTLAVANESNNHIKIDYIYDDNNVGRGEKDKGSYKFVAISDLESENYAVLSLEQIDYILETKEDEILIINGIEVPRNEIEKINTEKTKEIEERDNQSELVSNIFNASGVALGVGFLTLCFGFAFNNWKQKRQTIDEKRQKRKELLQKQRGIRKKR